MGKIVAFSNVKVGGNIEITVLSGSIISTENKIKLAETFNL
jgi:hypothetical protein